jgi:DNA-binding MarR family transcriptional regulator
MRIPNPSRGRAGPPPNIMQKIRERLSEHEVRGLETLFTLRATAQQVENKIAKWMAGSVGSAARYQILMALWAAKGKGMPHKDIVAGMGVTRATVSGLMAALERDGLVKSYVAGEDRRRMIARLTAKGEAVIKKQHELNVAKFRTVFACITSDELTRLTVLLHRFREAFATPC